MLNLSGSTLDTLLPPFVKDWKTAKSLLINNRLTSIGKAIYKRRKETVERSFADAKELHDYRYAKYRGLTKVKGSGLLATAVQNMKKIALMAA